MSAITSKTKKAIWDQVTTDFNAQAESKRSSEEIQKKWDNLVQRNKAIYMDFAQNRDRTGGGEAPSKLTPLTDAVMDVIGRHSANILGIASMEMDSTMLTLDSNCVPGDSSFATLLSLPLPSTSAGYTTPTQISISSDHSIPTWTSELGQSNGIQSVIDVIPTRVSKKAASGSQVFDCRCTCHSYIEKLKVTKLELQIKKLRKELREDIGEE